MPITSRASIVAVIKGYIDELVSNGIPGMGREDVIESVNEAVEGAWVDLVQAGSTTEYDVHDLVNTCSTCAAIIEYAEDIAWIEDDYGLWHGLTYGVLASIAYFSLKNCFNQLLEDRGVDINKDYPFEEAA